MSALAVLTFVSVLAGGANVTGTRAGHVVVALLALAMIVLSRRRRPR